jgi:hypothetical protein
MIENNPDNPQIKHLWVIHLFEANYNLSLKMLWGQWMVYQGEDKNCFGKQQHGSWPRHQDIDSLSHENSHLRFDQNTTYKSYHVW